MPETICTISCMKLRQRGRGKIHQWSQDTLVYLRTNVATCRREGDGEEREKVREGAEQ